MSNVIDFSSYQDISEGNFLEQKIKKIIDLPELELSDPQKNEILEYGNELWDGLMSIDNKSAFKLSLEIPCTDEQKERLLEQITEGVKSVTQPRTQHTIELIFRLITEKIRLTIIH